MQHDAWEIWQAHQQRSRQRMMAMLQAGTLTLRGHTMRFRYFCQGNKPITGYSLIFGLHGGGNCTTEVNDGQFNNHLHLYDSSLPLGSIWFIPRSCEEASDMWHKEYLEDFIIEIIEAFVLNDLVDANKVFLTGYSAGGDGIYHLAPRMADRLAGAAMMAGHPNKVELFNIRNLAFSIQVGANDSAYNRNKEAAKYIQCLNQLQQNYGGFAHRSSLHEGMPHWLQKKDAAVFGWLFSQQRNPYPDVILFKQHPRRKATTCYYIRIEEECPDSLSEELVVIKTGNYFQILSNRVITIMVNSRMVDPLANVRILHNGEATVDAPMVPSRQVMEKTLAERRDFFFIFEDQFVSSPPKTLDINQAIKERFALTSQQKQREYELPLPLHPTENQRTAQPKTFRSTGKGPQRTPSPAMKAKKDECSHF